MLNFTHINHPHIFMIGIGGTGSFSFESLMRLFSGANQTATIELYEGDIVESKNLKRQNFELDDLGKNKAQVLTNRFSKCLPHPPKVIVHKDYLKNSEDLMADIAVIDDDETAIVISCVDNIATRRLIDQAINDLTGIKDVIALDSGNTDQTGQVVIFSNAPVSQTSLTSAKDFKTQSMLEMFPEINKIDSIQDENPGLVAICEEESESKPQAMMANLLNGQIIANCVYEVSQNKPLAGNLYKVSLLDFSITPEVKNG